MKRQTKIIATSAIVLTSLIVLEVVIKHHSKAIFLGVEVINNPSDSSVILAIPHNSETTKTSDNNVKDDNKDQLVTQSDIKGITLNGQDKDFTFYGIPTKLLFDVLNSGSLVSLIFLLLIGWYITKLFESYLKKLIETIEDIIKKNDILLESITKWTAEHLNEHLKLLNTVEVNSKRILTLYHEIGELKTAINNLKHNNNKGTK